jgi:hypothetical protein
MRRPWILVLLAGCTSSPTPLDCPPGSREVGGACRNVCVGDGDCLPSETCSGDVCLPRVGDPDSGAEDIPRPRDAEAGMDIPWRDLAVRDFGPGEDFGIKDADDGPDGGVPCSGLDELTCQSRQPECTPGYCATCTGRTYTGCFGADDPPVICLAIPACPCINLDEASCLLQSQFGCQPHYCPTCQGNSDYAGCYGPTDPPPPACPPLSCGCAMFTSEADCTAAPGCHSVFSYDATCQMCSPANNCCMSFSFCGEGATAACTGMPLCRIPEPLCQGDTVVAYTDFCYEGCVRRDDCAP